MRAWCCAFPEHACVSTSRLRGSESLVGLVLCAMNVFWIGALVWSLVWNACGDSIKGRCVAAVLDASLGAEERGVETVEEAKALLAQRDATIAQHAREMASVRREKAQLTAANAEQDCRERIACGHSHGHPNTSPIVCRNAPNPQAAEITSLRTAKDKVKQITRSGSKGSARGGK